MVGVIPSPPDLFVAIEKSPMSLIVPLLSSLLFLCSCCQGHLLVLVFLHLHYDVLRADFYFNPIQNLLCFLSRRTSLILEFSSHYVFRYCLSLFSLYSSSGTHILSFVSYPLPYFHFCTSLLHSKQFHTCVFQFINSTFGCI